MSENPNNTSTSSQPLIEAKLNNLNDVERWYRDLAPQAEIDSVPAEDHLEAISTTVILSVEDTLPKSVEERNDWLRSFITESTPEQQSRAAEDIARAGIERRRQIADEREKSNTYSMIALDLVTEYAERSDADTDPRFTARLIGFAKKISASAMAETKESDPEEYVQAVKKHANLEMAELRLRAKYDSSINFSDEYIKLVRGEAERLYRMRVGEQANVAGGLFETVVGQLAKYKAWENEVDDVVNIRHATAREDAVSPRHRDRTARLYNHDIVIKGPYGSRPLQAKWYRDGDPESRVTLVREASDDRSDKLRINTAVSLRGVFEYVKNSRNTGAEDRVNDYIDRYPQIAEAIRSVSRPAELDIGASALVGANRH